MKRKMPALAAFTAFTVFALFTAASHAQTKAEKHACPGAMYSAGQFGFDNSDGFMPKKARAR